MKELSTRLYSKYLFAKAKAKNKFEEIMESEDGMEIIEVVILVAVALLIIGLVVNFLTKDGFEMSDGTKGGLVQYIFDKIKTALEGVFNTGSSEKTGG